MDTQRDSSRDRLVSIATGYWLGGRGSGFRFRARGKYFSQLYNGKTGSRAHYPPIQWVPEGVSPRGGRGGNVSGHEADHSSPLSAEIKNVGAIPPLFHMSSWRSA
jgi:hypothetical protein